MDLLGKGVNTNMEHNHTLLDRRRFLSALSGAAVSLTHLRGGERAAARPNIVFILADDLGYGDLSCYNDQSKIRTPHLDALARRGLRFTNAHTPSAVCTPTRYGLLTGRYAWRTRLTEGVLDGFDPPLIEPDRMTAAQIATRIYSGATNMPSYTKILTPDELNAIVAFVASRSRFPAAAAPAGGGAE